MNEQVNKLYNFIRNELVSMHIVQQEVNNTSATLEEEPENQR